MHPLVREVLPGSSKPEPKEIIILDIHRIRRDGATQGRATISRSVVGRYANAMRAGTEFPPVRIWFDGDNYWLSDGFQRIAAAELIGLPRFRAEIFPGTLEDARWDSYAANSHHGLRRVRADIESVIARALQHPKASQLSNNQIARHLNVPESTLRRWRTKASSPTGEDTSRIVLRGGRSYCMETANIGKGAALRSGEPRSWSRLRGDVRDMKELASSEARMILTIIEKWVTGRSSLTVCLEGIEQAIRDPSIRLPTIAERKASPKSS
jgi:hypothetical protein